MTASLLSHEVARPSNAWAQLRAARDAVNKGNYFVYRIVLPAWLMVTLLFVAGEMSDLQSRATVMMWTAWAVMAVGFGVEAAFLKQRIRDAFKARHR